MPFVETAPEPQKNSLTRDFGSDYYPYFVISSGRVVCDIPLLLQYGRLKKNAGDQIRLANGME
ncbi:MAG TPA: hypothetical protein VFF30_03310 [Nitrososphaerales archaeon]|nr:hypothetical protein [Nitrososphaerales archaeon]